MKVAEIKGARKPVVAVDAATPLAEVAATMRAHDIGALVVYGADSRMAGLITEREIVRALGSVIQAGDLTAADLMSSPVITCSPADRVDQVMQTMLVRRIRQLPLVEDGQLVGMISMGDVIKVLLLQMQAETNILRDLYLVASSR